MYESDDDIMSPAEETNRIEFVTELRRLGATDAEIVELSDTDMRDVIDASCLAHDRLSSLRGESLPVTKLDQEN
jgi:hypothetical protein